MAEAIAAPPAAVAAAPSPSRDQVAAAAARTTVNVSSLPKGDVPAKAPAPGSARERIAEDLQKKFGGEHETAQPKPPGRKTPQSPATPAGTQKPQSAAPGDEPTEPGAAPIDGEDPPAEAAAATDTTQPATTKQGGKVSPWKLVDQFKERATKAEQRALELEKQVVPEAKAKEAAQRLADYEKQVNDMREDLRYHNAEKYDPDILKANSEYEGAWKRAMSELKELTVTDPGTNATRPISADDLLELVNLPLAHAKEIADKVFPGFASEVMAYRKEIKTLFEAKQAKLDELKKTGSTRDQQRAEAHQKAAQEMGGFIKTTYEKAVSEALAHPELGTFLKPKDGDTEWNTRLEKATKFVDDSYAANSMDPKLTPEQRAEAIRRHAAVRNRAIAYSPMKAEIARLTKELAEKEAALKEFEETTPGTVGRSAAAAVTEAPRGMAGIAAELAKRVKRV